MIRHLSIIWLSVLLILAPRWAEAASPTSATEEEKLAAQKMFEAGDGLYEGGRYDDAILAFRNSHSLVSSPNSRLMLARSLREAGRNTEACDEFRGTIQDDAASGGRYPEARQAAESELSALESSFGHIEISQDLREQITELSINEKRVAVSAAAIPAVAGTVRLTFKLKDGSSSSSTVELARGQSVTLAKEKILPPKATPPQPPQPKASRPSEAIPAYRPPSHALRNAGWITAGVGGAGLAAFGVFAILNRNAYHDLEAQCSHGHCPGSAFDQVDAGRRYQLFANIGLGVAVAGAAAATTCFLLSPRKTPENSQLALSVSPSGFRVDGRF